MDGQLDSVIPKSAVTVRYLKEGGEGWAWWLRPVIPATQKVWGKRIAV
jgi:hypothetical protein